MITERRKQLVMSEKERKDIADMVKAAKKLAEKDPQGFILIKNSLNILKARAELDQNFEEENLDKDKEELSCQ